MSTPFHLRAQSLANPLGIAVEPADLAARPSSLDGSTVVLFNNSKLDPEWGNLFVIYEVLEGELKSRFPGIRPVRISLDLLGQTPDPVAEARALILGEKPDGVFMALADVGVSQRTMELALRLESEGIPTCVIGAPPGSGLAAAVARNRLPGLPVIDLPVTNTRSVQEVEEATRASLAPMLDGLTQPASALKAKFNAGQPGRDGLLSARAGAIQLPAFTLASGDRVDPNVWSDGFYESLTDLGLGDGLPVVLPTEMRVAAMMATVARPPDQVLLADLVPSGIPVTVQALAANAVMAGCRPEYFPIVLAAFEAMAEPQFRLRQAAITTHPGATLLMVSGPLAERLRISSGAGCLGPGHRANMTIGRALCLTLINVGRIRPGEADLATFGSPAEIALCFAENRAATPWSTFHDDHYAAADTCVLVHRCESPHAVVNALATNPELLLGGVAAVAATPGGNNAYNPSELIVILNPEHAEKIAQAGWSKRDVQEYLWKTARNPANTLAGRGMPVSPRPGIAPGEAVPVVNNPDEIVVVVAGGIGPHSMVALPWNCKAVHRKVTA
jgi:hypothetical protein